MQSRGGAGGRGIYFAAQRRYGDYRGKLAAYPAGTGAFAGDRGSGRKALVSGWGEDTACGRYQYAYRPVP